MTMNLGKSEVTAPHYNVGWMTRSLPVAGELFFLTSPFYRTAIADLGGWDFLFANTLLEPDQNRLLERISVAETAINERLNAMGNRDNAEKEALVDALRALHALRVGRSRATNHGPTGA
jgi:hypothetical protein